MKYTIIINQLALQEIASELDLIDAAILDYVIHFCAADDTKVARITVAEGGESKKFTWINYAQLMRELPILKIKSKAAISSRISKIQKSGFINTKQEHGNKGRLFVRVTEKIERLFFQMPSVRLNEQKCSHKRTGVFVQTNIQHSNNKQYKASPQNELFEGIREEEDQPSSKIPEKSTSGGSPKVLIDFFFEACKNIKGWPPEINGAAEGAMLKAKLKRYSVDDLRQELSWFLKSDESENLGCTIKLALSSFIFNKWLSQRGTYC